MRVSTSMLHASGGGAILKNQSELVRLQGQLSSGRRIQVASDDPIGAAQAMRLTEAKLANERLAQNQTAAKNALSLSEDTLARIGDGLQIIREKLVQIGSGALSASDRGVLAAEVGQQYDALLALANTRDGDGRYIFSGARADTQPFAAVAGGAVYNGDQSRRIVQVSSNRTLAISESGADLFERIRAGNGSFTASVGNANTGTASIDVGRLVDATAYNGHQYRLQFTVASGATTYDVVDVTSATTVSSGNSYSAGNAITLAGMQFTITGTPANGDTFDLTTSANQGMFAAVKQAITAMNAGQETPTQRAKATTLLGGALASIDQSFEHTLDVRARLGAGLAEIEMLADANAATDTALRSQISEIVDVDYAQAISEFVKQQQALEAAQASYARIMSLSLFDVLR